MGQTSEAKPHKPSTGPFIGWHTIYGADGDHDTPYMTRIWFGRLRLHIFHRGDADPDCHDHPWDFWTFPLTSYVEEVATPSPYKFHSGTPYEHDLHRQVVLAFRLTYRPATHCHRVIGRYAGVDAYDFVGWKPGAAPVPQTDSRRIVTLVWRGRQGRKWGFLRNRDGKWCWTPWKEYVFGGGKNAPCVDPRDAVDAAAIRDFSADLDGMTHDQMARELDDISEKIDRDTAWQEALAAALRQNRLKGGDT